MRCADAKGFTLVEIIVAFTVGAVLLSLLLRGFAISIGSSNRAETYGTATLLAESTLESLGSVLPLKDGADIDRQDGPFHVTATTRQYLVGDAPPPQGIQIQPYEVAVTVTWQEGAARRSIALRSLRLGVRQ